jgi:alkylhydroperoxidase family enzyme
MDIGSAVSRAMGITEEELADLGRYRDSDRFTELEKLAIDLAVAMTSTPADVPDDLRDALLKHLTKGQLAELAAVIAWENHRARLNRALGVRPAGFSDGAYCVLPERPW